MRTAVPVILTAPQQHTHSARAQRAGTVTFARETSTSAPTSRARTLAHAPSLRPTQPLRSASIVVRVPQAGTVTHAMPTPTIARAARARTGERARTATTHTPAPAPTASAAHAAGKWTASSVGDERCSGVRVGECAAVVRSCRLIQHAIENQKSDFVMA